MNVCFVVPTSRQLAGAGVRIRYQRIKAALSVLGWDLRVVPMDNIEDLDFSDMQFCIFSKCQDARSLLLASRAVAAGVAVGVDLFDDYFSQDEDSRFVPQRGWLHQMADIAQFFLCSTSRMLEIGERYFGAGRGHLLADPSVDLDAQELGQSVATKANKARRERRLSVLWFGIASNPSFPVGLSDLIAFSDSLRPFAEKGYKTTLTILTNTASLDHTALENLRRLPVPFVLREWNEQREEEALSRNFISFIPVNFQPFSIAKSLNRGISALAGGTQLLTAGYPLYDSLGEFVYDDAAKLIDDLENDTLKLAADTATEFVDWVQRSANPAEEARALIEFLSGIPIEPACDDSAVPAQAILHGTQSTAAVNRFAQNYNALTLGSPLLPGGIKCDAHLGLFGDDGELCLRMSQAAIDQLDEAVRDSAVRLDAEHGPGPEWMIPLDALEHRPPPGIANLIGQGRLANAAAARMVMDFSRDFYAGIFPGLHFIESELDAAAAVVQSLPGASTIEASSAAQQA